MTAVNIGRHRNFSEGVFIFTAPLSETFSRVNSSGPTSAILNQGGRLMPIKIDRPALIEAAGSKPKRIEEYVGLVNSQTSGLSIARMLSPGGWTEPGQKPEFTEYTIVLRGMLRVETEAGAADIHAGEAVIVNAGEWVQYSTPKEDGAEYIAVCVPAFSPDTVHRDDQ